MSNTVHTGPLRKLPSADWIAVGLAMLGLALGRVHLPYTGLLGVAVFGPSLLRELGWLKDSDEWQRGIMHRAGFHAAVALALFIFLNRVLPQIPPPYPELHPCPGVWFDATFQWQTLVMVFLVSYLLQYWGSLTGVARILMGFGGFMLIDSGVLAVRHGMWGNVWPLLASAGLVLLLGWAAPRRPKAVGGVLLLIFLTPLVLWLTTRSLHSSGMMAGMAASLVHIFLVFGITGAVLLKAGGRKE